MQELCLLIQGLSGPGALAGKSLSVWGCGVGPGCQSSDARRGSMCSSLPADGLDLSFG